jgi:signal transduction histidine kinase
MLHIIQGPDRGKRFALPDGEPQLIGRSSEALPFTDRGVSRRHAELTPERAHSGVGRGESIRWYIRDLESANGTFVNGDRITSRVELQPGDQIRCGSTLMAFALAPDEQKSSPIRVMDPELLEASVIRRLDASSPSSGSGGGGAAGGGDDPLGESMVLAQPDPVKAALEHLRLIYELTALTASAIERDELLNRVMDLIFTEFKPSRGFILLQDRPDARPDPVVVRYQQRPKTVDEGHIPVSRTIVQHVLRQGEGILSTNAMNDKRFRSGDSVRAYGIRSAICAPIRTAERIFGVIHIDCSIANFTYTESQLRLMNAIGLHTGLALLGAEAVSTRMQTERLAAMGQTVAWLSHSIKNILQGLRGGADALELAINRGDLSLAREGWPILARNLDRIYALTLNMLAYSKERHLEMELTPLGRIVQEAAELVAPQCEKKRVTLMLDLADDMPPVPADPGALHQALMNLLTNAVEAVPEKTGVVTVKTRYLASERQAEIVVIDNGPGIAPDQHERIFEPFVSTKGQRGTGLGLAVTRKIVQEHVGRIRVESDVNRGASFIITLPTDVELGDAADTSMPRPQPISQVEEEF